MAKYHKQLLKIISVIIFVLLILGCSHQKISKEDSNQQAIEEMQNYIKSLSDPKRKKDLLIHFEALNKSITDMVMVQNKYGRNFQAMFFKYDATHEDFKTPLDDFNRTRSKLQQDFLSSYFMMRKLTSAKEWEPLAKMVEEVLSDTMHRILLDKKNR